MQKFIPSLSALLFATICFAQDQGVSEPERQQAAMMLLLLTVGGLLLVFLLLWILRGRGVLPQEKPLPRPRWVHPKDDDTG